MQPQKTLAEQKLVTGRSKFAHKQGNNSTGGQKQFGQTSNQFMYRTNPKKQEPVLGIGPGGSDLSHFFKQDIDAAIELGETSQKPQTAGNLGSTVIISSEFGQQPRISSKSKQGPNITNIGFTFPQDPPIIVAPSSLGNNFQGPRGQVLSQSRTGSLNATSNDRSKSFTNQRQTHRRQGIVTSGEYSTNGIGQQLRLGLGFNSMKAFIQGSSLQKKTTNNNNRTQFTASQPAATKKATFTEYGFFSQKLAQKGIPKNQEIKYRKEMQQLKFYQTLNNYPYLVQQKQEKEKQTKMALAMARGQGKEHKSVLQTNQVPDTVVATTQVEMSPLVKEYQDIRGSTKQTVYVVHSSRQKLETSLEGKSPKAQKDTLYDGDTTKSGVDLQKSALGHNLQALGNYQNAPSYEKNGSGTSFATTNEKRQVLNSTNLEIKPSQQQVSTHYPSTDQRAIFEACPELVGNSGQPELDQPTVQTKKVALPALEPKVGTRKKKTENNYASNTSSVPLKNTGQTTTTKLLAPKSSYEDSKSTKNQAVAKSRLQDEVKQPIDKIEIKQQTASASYLTQTYKGGVNEPSSSYTPQIEKPKKVFMNTGTASQEQLKQQNSRGSRALMIQGCQMTKKGDGEKEINRARSMKPIAGPLIEKEEDAKNLYWQITSVANNDEVQTRYLKGVTPKNSGPINADIYRDDRKSPDLKSFTQASEQMPNQKQILQKIPEGSNKGTKDAFDEQVSGVGLGALFSVWGPSSLQMKQRNRRSNKPVSNNVYGNKPSAPYGKRQSNTADLNKRTGVAHQIGMGLDGDEPNMAHHMQLVNSIINDGSLHNLVFSNGSLNTEYLQQNKSQVAKMLSKSSPGRDTKDQNEYYANDEDEEDEDEDDDEHIIVTMLRSMNSRKLETCQLKDMKLEVDVEKIRSEIKLEYFKEIQKKFDTKLEKQWIKRLAKFDRLFNKIIAKKVRLDEENAEARKLEEQAKIHEERLNNPFYMTLKSQKEEREKFISFYENGMLLGLPVSNYNSLEVGLGNLSKSPQAIEDNLRQSQPIQDNNRDATEFGGDLFKHTRVDILDDYEPTSFGADKQYGEENYNKKNSDTISPISLSQQDPALLTTRLKEDIFCFYKLQTELPKNFFAKLGDSKVVKTDAVRAIGAFIRQEWPVFAKRKRITFRVSFDIPNGVFNTVPLGKEAPLSRCCMRNVNFVFSSYQGGTVLCMDPFCSKRTIDKFEMNEQLVHNLFIIGLNSENMQLPGETPNFMEQRRLMQDELFNSQNKIGKRYKNALSYEISKRINGGNFKHCKLQSVITDPKFYKDHQENLGGNPYESKELLELIMSVSHRSKGGLSYRSSNEREFVNENQMLAELIQKHSTAKHAHKAALPVSKLMKSLPKMAVPKSRQNQHPQSQAGTQRMDDGAYNVQFFDSMFQQSLQQIRASNEQIPNVQAHAQNMYTQENIYSKNQAASYETSQRSNADLPENSNQFELTSKNRFIDLRKNRELLKLKQSSGLKTLLFEQEGRHEFTIQSQVQRNLTMTNIAEENATSGNTILNLNDPKYSESKSPIIVSTLESNAITPAKHSPRVSTFENDKEKITELKVNVSVE